jgi:hypothetical protein
MPTIDVAHQHLLTSRALHAAHKLQGVEEKGGEFEVLDWSAIIAASRVAAGMEGFSSGKVSAIYYALGCIALMLDVQHSTVIRED